MEGVMGWKCEEVFGGEERQDRIARNVGVGEGREDVDENFGMPLSPCSSICVGGGTDHCFFFFEDYSGVDAISYLSIPHPSYPAELDR